MIFVFCGWHLLFCDSLNVTDMLTFRRTMISLDFSFLNKILCTHIWKVCFLFDILFKVAASGFSLSFPDLKISFSSLFFLTFATKYDLNILNCYNYVQCMKNVCVRWQQSGLVRHTCQVAKALFLALHTKTLAFSFVSNILLDNNNNVSNSSATATATLATAGATMTICSIQQQWQQIFFKCFRCRIKQRKTNVTWQFLFSFGIWCGDRDVYVT